MAGIKGRSGRKVEILKPLLQELLDESWPKHKRRLVIKALADAAIDDGNVEAAKTLLNYTYGKPAQRHEITGPDGGALEIEIDVRDQLRAKLANLARARGTE